MIISCGRGYIFVHIPKTGGTSLALALEGKALRDDILVGDTPKARRRRHRLKGLKTSGRLWKHSRLADIDGLVDAERMAGMFVFTLVRNPWDRVVSYYHWLRVQRFAHPAVALAKSLDFTRFLNHPATIGALGNNPYAAHVTDLNGVEHCDLFLRLEALDQDLPKLETRLGFRLPKLEHVNKSARKQDWRGYYSAADAELLGRICGADIARFGYGFDDAARPPLPGST